MLEKLIASIMLKSVSKDVVKMGIKKTHDEDIIKEKLGVSTIDEFMKMDIKTEKAPSK